MRINEEVKYIWVGTFTGFCRVWASVPTLDGVWDIDVDIGGIVSVPI